VKHEGSGSIDVGVPLSSGQEALLGRYEDLLRTRAARSRMIAASDLARLRSRHVLDALRGASLIPAGASLVYDLGSGAGLPGIPIAIAMPGLRSVVSERRRSRAAFLELVVDELELENVSVHSGLAEDLPHGADACLARAFGRPARCWSVAEPLLAPRGALLYWAGRETAIRLENVRTQAFFTPALADAGPIVMMTRQ